MNNKGLPAIVELDDDLDAITAFRCLASLPHAVYFDSALRHPILGRYSFVAADPFAWLEAPADGGDALSSLSELLSPFVAPSIADLPPYQGGAAGLFGYELGRSLERVSAALHDEFQVPALAVGLYDVVVAFDHVAGGAWLISQGFPETSPEPRRQRSADRSEQFLKILSRRWRETPGNRVVEGGRAGELLRRDQLTTQYASPGNEQLTSDFSADGYRAAVRRAMDYIHAGDVFQVNLSQRLLHPANGSAVELYSRLRERNAAPFAGFFDLGTYQLCSASPERFIAVRNGHVETRPIKGTRARAVSPEADLFAGDDLRWSEKDRAENVMIVDLLRNDLSRVCQPESVQVTQLCELETYAYVQHLVSAVEGRLQSSRTALDQLRAAFPGGSITGAPKVRAMEIIAELEPTARGAYCGALGYIGFDGSMDSSILIRTITAGRGWWQLPVGSGIVADSDPQREYEETWHKAIGLLRALPP